MSAARWKRGCAALVAACLLIAIVASALGAAGVWQGIVSPPWFDQTLGSLRVIGYRTWNANCQPYQGCAPTRNESYVVWLVVKRSDVAGPRQSVYQFVRLPIELAPRFAVVADICHAGIDPQILCAIVFRHRHH
jgi:hypothetical protein